MCGCVALIIDACRLPYFLLVLTYYYYNNYDVNIYNDNNKVTNKTRQEKRCDVFDISYTISRS